MSARLVSLDGPFSLALKGTLAVVGRHRECDLRLDSSRVSRRHCCLALEGDTLLVRDLGSTNGTWINGDRIGAGILRFGDELGVAHLRFRMVPDDADPRENTLIEGRAPQAPPSNLRTCGRPS